MKAAETIEGKIDVAGQGRWRIGPFVLMAGTVVELCLSGSWILGTLSYCGGAICKFVAWEDGVEISLRPGLYVCAHYWNRE